MEYEMEMESLHIGFESESPPSGTECGAARKSGIYQAQRPARPSEGGGVSARNDARATFIGLSNALRAAAKREACRDLVCDNKMMMILHKISSL